MKTLADLRVGAYLTIIFISEFMACTCRRKVLLTRQLDDKWVYKAMETPKSNPRGKERPSKKEFYLTLSAEVLIFEGLETPGLVLDGEAPGKPEPGSYFVTTKFRGNASYNFVGDTDTIRKFLLEKNLNTAFCKEQYCVNWPGNGDEEELVFPEAIPTSSLSRTRYDRIRRREASVQQAS